MIYPNSRYADGHVVKDDGGVVAVERNWSETDDSGYVHVWREGDRLDQLAQRIGLPRTSWWRILDANPAITNPASIETGARILLPKSLTKVT